MEELTIKQKEVYDFICKYIKNYGYSPSVRDISKVFNHSTATIHSHLLTLKEKGYIDYVEGKARTIKIINNI